MGNRLRWLSLLLIGGILLVLPAYGNLARAAGGMTTELSTPETSGFPLITTYLELYDEQGRFVQGLQASQVTILEDSRPLPLVTLEELHSGAQLAVAINPGPSFGVRDGEGHSRFYYVVQGLRAWASALQSPGSDDLSILFTGGPEKTHLSDPAQWVAALESFQADVRTATPSLDILSRAMEIVTDPAPRPGMGRAVLFITPPPEGDLTIGLQNLEAQANQQGIRIFIWIVSSPDQFTLSGATQLRKLAENTRGRFFGYSGVEAVPNLEDYLKPLRDIYSLAYQSHISTSGMHQVAAEIRTDNFQATTPPVSVELEVQPPNPMFVSPPVQIIRTNPPNARDLLNDLVPRQQILEVLIEFPDGFSRPISATLLYVDGSAIVENKQPPFDRMNWDLTPYTMDGNHRIRVEAIDSLGLHGQSTELPIQITVNRTPQSFLMTLYNHGPLIASLAVLLAGAVLVLVLILGGRIRPRAFSHRNVSEIPTRPLKKIKPAVRNPRSDPVTQPVLAHGESAPRGLPHWISHLQWPQRRVAPQAFAYLARLTEADEPSSFSPIPITADVMTLGEDPIQANLVIDDPSVDGLHARLAREGSTYRLSDQGSIAGTWVNYSPISKEGVLLEHGDIIHIGRVGFRFTLRQPTHIRKPVVTPEEPPS